MPGNDRDAHALPQLIAHAERPSAEEDGAQSGSTALPAGLRQVRLTIEAAEKIRQFLDDPNRSAHAGREMAEARPSVLRKSED